jgi:hypothetical protein
VIAVRTERDGVDLCVVKLQLTKQSWSRGDAENLLARSADRERQRFEQKKFFFLVCVCVCVCVCVKEREERENTEKLGCSHPHERIGAARRVQCAT